MTSALDIWLVDLAQCAAGLEASEATTPRLSDDIEARLAAMRDDAGRRERRLAHIALRIALEMRLGEAARRVPFEIGRTGKPSLAKEGIGFSLAHTHGLALIAVGPGPLGVDIERWRKVRIPQARRPSIEAEAVALAAGAPLIAADADARFINAWVRVEAVAKALGTGVAPILERLRPGRAVAPADASEFDAPARITVQDLPVAGGIFAAVAQEQGPPSPLLGFPETRAAIEALVAARRRTTR